MKTKNSKNSTTDSKRPKTLSPYQTIQDLMAWQNVKMSDTIIDHLCDYLLEWSLKEHSISLVSALREYGIPPFKFYRWLPQSEKLQMAHESVKMAIGENLLKLGMYRKADPSFIHPRLPIYQEDFTIIDKQEKDFKREIATIKNDTMKNMIHEIQFVERTVNETPEVSETVKRSKKRKKHE
jgi:hypothetical protein